MIKSKFHFVFYIIILGKCIYVGRRDRAYSAQGDIHKNAWRLAKKLYTKLRSYEHAKEQLCMLMKMNEILTLDKLVAHINSIDENIEPL